MIGTGLPVETVEGAQIAFSNQITWAIVAGNKRMSGVWSMFPMPGVDCPIVDMDTTVSDDLIHRVIMRHVSPLGVDDVQALVLELERLGLTVARP